MANQKTETAPVGKSRASIKEGKPESDSSKNLPLKLHGGSSKRAIPQDNPYKDYQRLNGRTFQMKGNLKCIQINFQKSRAASSVLRDEFIRGHSNVGLVQELWINKGIQKRIPDD